MFFRRVELGETRPLNPRLSIIPPRGHLLLLHAIVHHPNFRAVVAGSIANDYDLKDRIVRREIEFVVELRDQRTKLFQKSNADRLQIRCTFARRGLVLTDDPANILKIAVQPDGLGIGGERALANTAKNTHERGTSSLHA